MKSKFTLKIPPFFMARAYLQVIKKADFLKYPKQFLQIALFFVLLFAVRSVYAQNSSPVCASPQTFNYTGGVQDFVVPSGVALITIAATGADGGGSFSGFPNVGGTGGVINVSFSVLPGDNIRVIVGEAGKSTFGGGGGGGTAVINCGNPANCATGTLMIVAGGGGGGRPGSSAGGGATAVAGNGAAGADGVGGGGGGGVNGGGFGGHNGSQASKTNISAGGSGGGTASDGGKGFGGGGGIQSPPGGGGGGGGYTGGDGSVLSGGNGGSNFVASTAIVGFTNTGGVNAGSGSDNTNGVVVLSYTCPDPCAIFTNNRVYVNQAIASSGDGSSWATAFKTLQEALTLNCPSITQIWVAKGTYYPTTSTTDRNASFSMKNGVAIYGGFAGNEAANYDLSLRNFVTNVTILSGDIDGVPDMVTGSGSSLTITGNAGNAYHVVLNNNNNSLTSSAILDGFTISGGNANSTTPSINIYGGGMYNNLVSPTLRNVTFLGNSASFTGGGLYTSNGNLTLTKCQFTNNLADFGGAIQTQGTVSSLTATITMVDCSLTGNRSFTAGGINHGFSNSRGQLLFDCNRCVFSNNYAYNGSNYGSAGAFFNEQVGFDGRFTNCLFDGNQGLGNDPD